MVGAIWKVMQRADNNESQRQYALYVILHDRDVVSRRVLRVCGPSDASFDLRLPLVVCRAQQAQK